MERRAIWPVLTLAAAAWLVSSCHSASGPKSMSELTPTEMQGRQIFVTRCAGCHLPDSNKKLVGPGLQALFKKPYLPSGAPANDGWVRSRIIEGRAPMPAFGNSLDEQQLNQLLAYLHTL